jgi:transposase-like protein
MKKLRNRNRTFSKEQMSQLENNPNVQRVSEISITYAPTFKLESLKAYEEGQSPMEIFLKAGFDIEAIGHKIPKESLKRWRDQHAAYGDEGVLQDQRGRGSKGSKSENNELSPEEKLKRAEARIKFLEAENDFLKKLEALERKKQKR